MDDVLDHFQEEGTSWAVFVSYFRAPEGGATPREVLLKVTSGFERYLFGHMINEVGIHVDLVKDPFR